MNGGDAAYRVPLRALLEGVGSPLVEVAAASDEALDRPVLGIQVGDPLRSASVRNGYVLLAIGVDPSTPAAASLIDEAVAGEAVAVLFHSHAPIPEDIRTRAGSSVAVLEARIDIDWDYLLWILRRGIEPRRGDEIGGVPIGDLFGFANSLATRIHGAVTIEDPQSRVLAYSTVHVDLDEPRKETILGRRVPDRYTAPLGEELHTLRVSDQVVPVPADPDLGRRRRLAVAIRAGGESIGSIWVADVGEPMADDADDILREAGQTATLHLIRHTTGLDDDATMQDSMVHQLLDGSHTPDVVAIHLGLGPDAPGVVVAFEYIGDVAVRSRLRQAITMYCSAFRRDVPIVDRGPRVYMLLPAPDGLSAELRRFATDAARRASAALDTRVLAGIGTVADRAGSLPRSRDDADRALRVLLNHPEHGDVAAFPDVLAHANLLELLDVLRERRHLQRSKLDTLRREPRHEIFLVAVEAHLAHFGDVRAAARSLDIHPNTFRYRLKRAVELSGIDLDDDSERLMVALQLRLDR